MQRRTLIDSQSDPNLAIGMAVKLLKVGSLDGDWD